MRVPALLDNGSTRVKPDFRAPSEEVERIRQHLHRAM
jgi:hypothetical protein